MSFFASIISCSGYSTIRSSVKQVKARNKFLVTALCRILFESFLWAHCLELNYDLANRCVVPKYPT